MPIKQLIHDVIQVLTTNHFAFKENHGVRYETIKLSSGDGDTRRRLRGQQLPPPPPNFPSGNFLAKKTQAIFGQNHLIFRKALNKILGQET